MSFIPFSEWMPIAYVWTVASTIRIQTRYGCTGKLILGSAHLPAMSAINRLGGRMS